MTFLGKNMASLLRFSFGQTCCRTKLTLATFHTNAFIKRTVGFCSYLSINVKLKAMDSARSGGSLSQYFADDPPSFFDEISANSKSSNDNASITTETTSTESDSTNYGNFSARHFIGVFEPTEYIDVPDDLLEEQYKEIKVHDDVRCFWKPPVCDPLRPPTLTKPGLQTAVDLPDKIAEAAKKYLGDSETVERKVLGVDDVTQDERGIRKLIANGCLRSAVNLTGRLLTIYGQGFGHAGQPSKQSPHSLQLWFARLTLLAKLGEYELLQAEAEPFEDLMRPDIYYEFYPEMYKGRFGSIACFSFRLFLAELPIYLGNAAVALDKLAEIYKTCNEIKDYYIKTETADGERAVLFWKKRVLRIMHSIVNCALVLKKFNLIDDLLKQYSTDDSLTKAEKRALFSGWGRIYLQIGDVFGAEQKFAEGRRLREMQTTPSLRDLVDKGLVALAHNNFPEAYSFFQKALHLDNSNTMVLNNMSVCLLYAGKLQDAINLLERAINLNPQRSLDESLLINLSTLYELESNNSIDKKKILLRLISLYKPDLRISLEICLKLAN